MNTGIAELYAGFSYDGQGVVDLASGVSQVKTTTVMSAAQR
ncbi:MULTISPECIES: hypothetical protein [unclassified Nonomuraea]